MKHSEGFGDVDPLMFELLDKFILKPYSTTTIVNDPPKIPFIHSKDMLKKYPKLTGYNELD